MNFFLTSKVCLIVIFLITDVFFQHTGRLFISSKNNILQICDAKESAVDARFRVEQIYENLRSYCSSLLAQEYELFDSYSKKDLEYKSVKENVHNFCNKQMDEIKTSVSKHYFEILAVL